MPSVVDFFTAVYGNENKLEQGVLLVTDIDTTNKFYKHASKCASLAVELSEKRDVYFGTGIYSKPKTKGHGCEIDIVGRGFFCLDIDMAHGVHKKKTLPKDEEEVFKVLKEAFHGIEPTAAVRSGGGLHLYYAFKEVWFFDKDEERDACKRMSVMFHRVAHTAFAKVGWGLDNVANLNRLLRVPGTINHKDGKRRPVEIMFIEPRYIVPDFIEEIYNEEEHEVRESGCVAAGKNPFNLVIDSNAEPPAAKFAGLYATHIKFKAAWECKEAFSRQKEPSLSDYQMVLANIARNYEWTDQEICNLMIAHRRIYAKTPSQLAKLTPKRIDYYTATIKKTYDNLAKHKKFKDTEESSEVALTGETEEIKEDARGKSIDNLRGLLDVNITDVVVYKGIEDSFYALTIDGVECNIGDVSMLFSFSKTKYKIADLTKRVIKTMKKEEWDIVVAAVLACAREESVGAGMSDTEIVKERVIVYVSEQHVCEGITEAAPIMAPFTDGEDTYIFLAGFREWMAKRNDRMEPRKLGIGMKRLGHEAKVMSVQIKDRKTTRNVYKLNKDNL